MSEHSGNASDGSSPNENNHTFYTGEVAQKRGADLNWEQFHHNPKSPRTWSPIAPRVTQTTETPSGWSFHSLVSKISKVAVPLVGPSPTQEVSASPSIGPIEVFLVGMLSQDPVTSASIAQAARREDFDCLNTETRRDPFHPRVPIQQSDNLPSQQRREMSLGDSHSQIDFFYVIRPFTTLSSNQVAHDPYRFFTLLDTQLYKDEFDPEEIVIRTEDIVSHFVSCPYESPELEGKYRVVVSLDRMSTE
ncbi:hypothetical protein BJ138DRAFT_1106647 [Hygrophoropsis aurantiaca]|uniref:Uncharacterized protein n=1 Tax=Hygrophoropsis aurantiaca TaxID=72124 RepID=A0ACB7ZTV7_9AGAM|nr:hypothetical protein BJ138DRAFT_1106647 [Hygrophoropsis aurantiaca]